MSNVNPKVKELDISEKELEMELASSLGEYADKDLQQIYEDSVQSFEVGKIIKGRIVTVNEDDVVLDIGYKSEGIIPLHEFGGKPEIEVGQEIEVLLEAVEDESGLVVLSKRKADYIRGWERTIAEHNEGDVVTGRVMRKIKGGLLVDIGVPVFLPASQVNIRRPGDIAEYIGKEIQCKILKIDEARRNIVVSRRRLIEEKRAKQKEKLMKEIEVGQTRKGVVKNIADFGAFVDLGGIDGLLHITDMSWGRVSHPSEIVKIDDEIEVKILGINREEEKIALGLKQKTRNPWEDVLEKFPVGSRVKGQVVNVTNYGAFVKLIEGVEGLVHISEMSWTKRINHPSEMVAIGDIIEVVVLNVNIEKQEISLGMKQIEANPWEMVMEKYPEGSIIEGRVRNLTNYGAFIELEEGIDGLLHVSDMSWTKKVNHPSEIVKKGDKIKTMILSVDQQKKRVALGMKQLIEDPWKQQISEKYHPGDIVSGRIVKITNFGVFVQLEPELEGLLHISELADRKVDSPEEIVKVGDDVQVKVLKVDTQERKIGLSLRQAAAESKPQEESEAEPGPETEQPQAPEADSKEQGEGADAPET